jgi:ABC-type protease/lipase transport system fused ATPase/permease subunit
MERNAVTRAQVYPQLVGPAGRTLIMASALAGIGAALAVGVDAWWGLLAAVAVMLGALLIPGALAIAGLRRVEASMRELARRDRVEVVRRAALDIAGRTVQRRLGH